MNVKDLARRCYHAIPDGPLRRRMAALAYRLMYRKDLAGCSVRDGLFTVRTKDGVVVRSVKDFDPQVLATDLAGLSLPPGAVALDIGANIGAASLYLAAKVGDAGRVIAYEPDSANLEVLRRNLDVNAPTSQVEVVPKGICDQDGELEFYAGGNYTSSLMRTSHIDREADQFRVVKVPVTTIDTEAQRLGLTRLDFVKLDIEGAEVAALRGARETLTRFRPTLFVETHVVEGRSTLDDVEQILGEYGYGRLTRCNDGEFVTVLASTT